MLRRSGLARLGSSIATNAKSIMLSAPISSNFAAILTSAGAKSKIHTTASPVRGLPLETTIQHTGHAQRGRPLCDQNPARLFSSGSLTRKSNDTNNISNNGILTRRALCNNNSNVSLWKTLASLKLENSSLRFVRTTYVTAAEIQAAIPPQNLVSPIDIKSLNMADFPPERIRNFCIIAHIDHGKSTLADRLLKLTGTLAGDHTKAEQFSDALQVERERGITVKAQTASIFYKHNGEIYLLNLIDTPGHVDFSYEVSRSMAACQGALILVDAGQGIQAQTLANFYLSMELDLKLIPIMTKLDQSTARPNEVAEEMEHSLGVSKDEIMLTSAKNGYGCAAIPPAIIERIPKPTGDPNKPLKAFIFDSWFDEFKGVICLIEVVDGFVKIGDQIVAAHSKQKYEVQDLGIMYPHMVSTKALYTGQVGYIVCAMKTAKEARIGDTLYRASDEGNVEPFPGFKAAKPMVFAGIYPVENEDFERLQGAIDKLLLTDASVTVQKESSLALGMGFRCGFLGLLHMDVFNQRLDQEFGASVIITSPTVTFKILMDDGTEHYIRNPNQFPTHENISGKAKGTQLHVNNVKEYFEPVVESTIITPDRYLGNIITLCQERRGEQLEMSYLDDTRVFLRYRLPLSEIIQEFYDQLKSISQGYASFDYEEKGYVSSDLVKLVILLNGKPVDAMCSIVHRSKADRLARELVKKLKNIIPKQMFEVAVQAAIGSRIIARETIKGLRKDVTAKCYGGDITRKRKLLEKQKAGKKKMKKLGNVELPQEAFLALYSSKVGAEEED